MELPESFVPGWHDEAEVRKMKFRTLPHYGKVSVISFGASGLGGMFTAGQGSGLADATVGAGAGDVWFAEDADADKAAAREIVQMCLKAGVNVIDTSHWYGQGRLERLLGHALKGARRSTSTRRLGGTTRTRCACSTSPTRRRTRACSTR